MFRVLIKLNSMSINESSCSIAKKYFSSIRTAAAPAIDEEIQKKRHGYLNI